MLYFQSISNLLELKQITYHVNSHIIFMEKQLKFEDFNKLGELSPTYRDAQIWEDFHEFDHAKHLNELTFGLDYLKAQGLIVIGDKQKHVHDEGETERAMRKIRAHALAQSEGKHTSNEHDQERIKKREEVKIRIHLSDRFRNDPEYMRGRIEECVESPEADEDVRRIQSNLKKEYEQHGENLFEHCEMHTLEYFLMWHIEGAIERINEFYAFEHPELLEKYYAGLKSLTKTTQPFRLNINGKIAKIRMLETVVKFTDSLTHTHPSPESEYHSQLHELHLSNDIPRGELFYQFAAGMTEALAGRTIGKMGRSGRDEVFYLRRGLQFGEDAPADVQPITHPRFEWLHWGVIEIITQAVCNTGKPLNKLVHKQRELVDALIAHGNTPIGSYQPLVDAYFESYEPSKPQEKRIPAFKHLLSLINDSYGFGFLVRLDQYVEREGVDKAVQQMRKDWKKI